LINHYKN